MPVTKKTKKETSASKTLYTIKLEEEQRRCLKEYCNHHLWEPFTVDYAAFAFKHKPTKVNVVAYKSGKVVISGKGTEDFVINVLEAEITQDPRWGYESVLHPEWFEDHAGMDEAGKGDFFGPLVCATVIADGSVVQGWMDQGIKDSKKTTDARIFELEKIIRKTKGVVIQTAYCSLPKYNTLMGKPNANLNELLAWLHAKALENALKEKAVAWGMLDQFSKKNLVAKHLKKQDFDLRMQTKAEEDPVVAAASIIARATFVRQIEMLSDRYGEPLLKGASAQVKKQGRELVAKLGKEALGDFAKMHFKTAYEVLDLPVPKTRSFYDKK